MLYTRRTVLKVALTAAAATAFVGKIKLSALAQGVRVRRTLHGMPLNDPDLSTYRDFVRVMKDKEQEGGPVNWLNFADQHGSLNGGYKFCPHGDWYFLPWHRAYVMMYENSARELMGNKDFALPYWDWTEDRTLPPAFAESMYQGKPNPLYVPNRNKLIGPNALTDHLVGPQTMKEIYSETLFEVFGTGRNPEQKDLDPKWVPAGGGKQGVMEFRPHNQVHNRIGAFMPTAASPRDPVFFMHHCNIDRIWATWNALGRKNSTDNLWLNMPFTNNYIAPDGTRYSYQVKDLVSIKPFGYTYDELPTPDNKVVDEERHRNLLSLLGADGGLESVSDMQRVRKLNTVAAKASEHLEMQFTLEDSTLKSVTSTLESAPRTPEVVALIKDIRIGDDVSGIRVFINRDNLSLEVPVTDPHFVTTLTFLKMPEGGTHKGLPSAIVDLTRTLIQLGSLKRLNNDNITIQLLPVPKAGVVLERVGTVVPASVEIAVI